MNLRTHHMIIFFLLAVSCKQSYIPPAIAATPGTYIYPAHQFLDNTPYRLHITTGGKDYTSDYVPLAYNPPIDSITFARVQTAPNDGKSDSSTTIVLASTAQLSQDLVYHAPVVFIPNGSQQMTVKYSILVKQNTLTKPAFQWWQTLQKNTEQIGSIFGVQPSANPGNIHCTTDSAEQVLGYIGGGNTDSVRIFVTSGQIAPWEFHPDCDDKVVATPGNYYIAGYLPWLFEPPPSGKVHIAYASCIDCRLIGSNSKPPFWQ